MKTVLERFLNYVSLDTASDYYSETIPSTEKQKVLANVLYNECKKMGFDDVHISEFGYVYSFLKGNAACGGRIGFIAHMDTSPDCKGSDIKPQIIKNYDGGDITLNNGRTLSPNMFLTLKDHIGEDIVTADGTTLLGADDKAGIAEIMSAMEKIIESKMPHGDIYVAFTPDEEIGRGMDKFDLDRFKPEYAFTIDGGRVGELEYESFNAARAEVTITGESVHPGSAKGIMKNAALIASEFIEMLPKEQIPAETEGYEGFYHINTVMATVEKATVVLLIRDFEQKSFEGRKIILKTFVAVLCEKYGDRIKLDIKDEYFNMGEIISQNMEIIEIAKAAYRNVAVEPIIQPIRGGTDGSRLSFMGIPCPNIFTGGHNFHGPYEYISVQAMEKAVNVIEKVIANFSNKL